MRLRCGFAAAAAAALAAAAAAAPTNVAGRIDSGAGEQQLTGVGAAPRAASGAAAAAWADHFQQRLTVLASRRQPEPTVLASRQHPEAAGITIFVAAAFCTSLSAGLAASRLRSKELEAPSPPALAVYVCTPWFLATAWLFHVAARSLMCSLAGEGRCVAAHAAQPARCHWLACYLLLAPALTALVAVCQVAALFDVHARSGDEAPMGRMFQRRPTQSASPWSAIIAASARLPRKLPQEHKFDAILQHSTLRNTLLLLEALAMVLGAALTASGGAACEAGLWWAAASFTIATLVVLSASTILLALSRRASRPSLQDDLKLHYGIVYASPPSSAGSSPCHKSPAEPALNLRSSAFAQM